MPGSQVYNSQDETMIPHSVHIKLSLAQRRLFRAMELDVKLGVDPDRTIIATSREVQAIEVAMLRCMRTAQAMVKGLRATRRRIV